MADWTASMQQTFEFYKVDPATWKDDELLTRIKSATVNRDVEVETLGSATIDTTELLDECYVRIYLITVQNGVTEKHALATVMIQTPSSSSDGKITNMSMDAYTPLIELKENPPPLGYSLLEGENIMDIAGRLTDENMRAPVVTTKNDTKLVTDFVASPEDKWLTFLSDLIANAKYRFDVDEMGRILFAVKQDTASLSPVWTYNDDNSSILHPDITMEHDMFGIPNVVEVIYSDGKNSFYAKAVNKDKNSPISTVNRGRIITHRVTNPDFGAVPSAAQIKEYAEQLLRDMSTVEYSVTYTHGYCPVRIGDCVLLNYTRADLSNIKARVISQSIKCEPGCPVTEKAVFTKRLWR